MKDGAGVFQPHAKAMMRRLLQNPGIALHYDLNALSAGKAYRVTDCAPETIARQVETREPEDSLSEYHPDRKTNIDFRAVVAISWKTSPS